MAKPTTILNFANGLTNTTIVGGLVLTTVAFQSLQTYGINTNVPVFRLSFSGSPNLSTVLEGHKITVTGCTNALNNGTFLVMAKNNTAKTIDIINFSTKDNTYDESGLTASAVVKSGTPIKHSFTSEKLNLGFVMGEKATDGQFNALFGNIYDWINYVNNFTNTIATIDDLKALDVTTNTGFLYYVVDIDAFYTLDTTLTSEVNDDEYYVVPTGGGGTFVKTIPTFSDEQWNEEITQTKTNTKYNTLVERVLALEAK